jgi:hypothetical protein
MKQTGVYGYLMFRYVLRTFVDNEDLDISKFVEFFWSPLDGIMNLIE